MFVLNKTYNALLDLQRQTEKINERNLNLFNEYLRKKNKNMEEMIINEV